MRTDLPKLPISEFIFCYEPEDGFKPLELNGSLWHGVFGKALKEISCFYPGLACEQCMFLHSCNYSYLFAGVRPPQAELMTRYRTVPVPHVFRTGPVEQDGRQVSVQMSAVPLLLIGDSARHFSVVVQAMHLAGLNGLGKQRQRLRLARVLQKTGGQTHTVVGSGVNSRVMPPRQQTLPDVPPTVLFRLMTPYKSEGRGNVADGFDIGKFLMQTVRRISLLQYFYCAARLDADFVHLKSLTENIQARQDLVYRQGKRYSANHGTTVDVSGFVGTFELDMAGREDLWPYIYLGQWLHTGKNASMGFGRYEVAEL